MEEKKPKEFSRRDFIKTSAIAGAGAMIANNSYASIINSISSKKKFVVVGVGHRSQMWQDAIYKSFADNNEIVGFCDTNLGRLKHYQEYAKKITGKTIPLYDAKDFDKMIKETKPETVIVTTVDATHDYYIVRAMDNR